MSTQMVVPAVDPMAAPFVRDDTGAAGLDPATLNALKTATAPCGVTVTYPYADTVFPGGLTPPVIMWTGAADAAYLHFAYDSSDRVDYSFAAKVGNPAELKIPREVWDEITRRTNRLRLFVTLNVSAGGAATSCKMQWKIAAGNMVGALYYNTYQAPPPAAPGQGAVMRQTLGAEAEIYKRFDGAANLIPGTGPCYSCHSVSFNGGTLVASFHDYQNQVFRVEKFDITQGTQPMASATLDNANFGALTPDGKKILSMGNPQCTAGSDTFPRKPNNFPLVEGAAVARLLDTATGANLNAVGLNKDFYMWMPQFSPDGKKIVFSHAKPDASGGTDRRELATMDFDYATNTFSNLKVIVQAGGLPAVPAPSLNYTPNPSLGGVLACGAEMCSADPSMPCVSTEMAPAIPGIPGDTGALPMGSCTGPCYPAWPFFTPDSEGVVYALTSEPDYMQAFPGRDQAASSELWYLDIDSNQTLRLDNINKGLEQLDATSNYYPTVMPVTVGGYFWVFWTAMRDYGHKVQGRSDPSQPVVAAVEAPRKRIWGAAIQPKLKVVENVVDTLTDPSSPGFYLDGQSDSGNVRAFAALNPCLQNGSSCMSGLDCCCGYCNTNGTDMGSCTCDPPKCSKINEKCTKDADCCPQEKPEDPLLSCIAGFCNFIVLN